MNTRDRRHIIPSHASLMVWSSKSQKDESNLSTIDLFDIYDAVPESTGSLERVDDTSSDFYLNGEGTSNKNKHSDSVISNSKQMINQKSSKSNTDKNIKNIFPPNQRNDVVVFDPYGKRLRPTNKERAEKWIKKGKAIRSPKTIIKNGKEIFAIKLVNQPLGRSKDNQLRIPVVNPDGTPGMPTKSSRARKWIEEGKAKPMRTKTGIFYVQLVKEPSGRNKQPIVATLDPGSRYSGVAVCSNKAILYTCNLELIADEKKNPFASIKNRMDKRRELRRSRRHRNCRRRPARFDNRSKTGKMAPSIKARKQLELKEIKELTKIYPISIAGIEDVSFNHYTKRWGKNFSQVEVGKKWGYEELKKIIPGGDVRLIKGYETNVRREQLKLKKSSKKDDRNPDAHVTDCIAMGSIILGLGMETKTQLIPGINFDIITRPKYSRRKLHNEKVNPQDKRINKKELSTIKGHRQRKRFGGTTTDWTNIRKGDYIEVTHRKKDDKRRHGYIPMVYRGWIGGFENDKHLVSLYNFDWKVVGQYSMNEVRLLNRNHGLMVKSMEMEEIAHNLISGGMKQSTVDGSSIDIENIKKNLDKPKHIKDGTEQIGIDDAWNAMIN